MKDGAKPGGLFDAKAAAEFLGVKRETLYAYVSRGLIRTFPASVAGSKMYLRQDLEQLQFSGRGRSKALGNPRQGPSLATSITVIDKGGPCYRGKNAVELARKCRPFEDCVELLWTGVLPSRSIEWGPLLLPPNFDFASRVLRDTQGPPSTRQVLAVVTALYAARMGRSPEATLGGSVLAARQLLQLLAASVRLLTGLAEKKGLEATRGSIAARIAKGAGIATSGDFIDAINACLILSADHELAPSTYAARVAASGGADVFACVVSGFGTFEGPLNGLGCDEPEQLLRSSKNVTNYVSMLRARIKRNELPIGYNHPSYANGDPRAQYLIELARSIAASDTRFRTIMNCIGAAQEEFDLKPSLALGLIAMAVALRMPAEMPGVLMAIGRSAGWIAHVFEQRTVGDMARPRTRYVGPAVDIT